MSLTKAAITLLITLTVAVGVNAYSICRIARGLIRDIESVSLDKLPEAAEHFEKISDHFSGVEKYISITVSHDDLTNIEESFSEIIGAARAADLEEVLKIKSRLTDALVHLGRLSGINIDSIL